MLKNQYYPHKKHCLYFSLYWSSCAENEKGMHMVVASKRGVHQKAVKRNFAKRRLRTALRNFLKYKSMPAVTLKLVAKKEILSCSFAELNLMVGSALKVLL